MPENVDPNLNESTKKPVNPQMETVLMNQPNSTIPNSKSQIPNQIQNPNSQSSTIDSQNSQNKNTPSSVAPSTKIAREKGTASRRKFLLGCFGGFIFLFVIFIVLMVLMIARSGGNNPIIASFGLDAAGMRSFLQGLVGFTFGAFSLFFLVLAVIGLFRFFGAQKSDKEKRKHNIRVTLVSSLALVFLVFIWVILAGYISRMQINLVTVKAEILVLEPEDLTGLEAPVEIRFSAENVATALLQSGLDIEAMRWDLDGDGIFETPIQNEAEITRIYNQRGAYNVGLEVVVSGEETPRVYNKLITIDTALFEATPTEGAPPLEVQFDASNIVDEDEVSSLDWDFDGDGQFELEGPDNLSPQYTFEQIGSYTVLLRVINKNGSLDRYTREIEITESSTPLISARVEAVPGLTGMAPFQVRLDGGKSSSLRGSITSYEWDFGDGSNLESGRSVSHTYDEPGLYEVVLKVEDDMGNRAQTKAEVEVTSLTSVPEPVIETTPEIGMDDPALTGTIPFKVAFDASKTKDIDDDIVLYEWDFDGDDKVDAQGVRADHTYIRSGTYVVALTVTDAEDQAATGVMTIIVEEPGVQAVIEATPEEGTAPLVVQFDGSSSSSFQGNIVSYEWDFGDGTPKAMTAASVSHKFDRVGTYTVTLRVVTNTNQSATSTMQIFVREVPLKACFDASRTSGPAPLTVSFNSKCSSGLIKAYEWQYGDGDDSTSVSPTHTFESPGTYTVTLEVTDDKNNVSMFNEAITVE